MTVENLMALIDGKNLTAGVNLGRQVEKGFVSDLLSWVMAQAEAGTAWITVQTHLNVIAVAELLDMACIIIPDGQEVEKETVDKAVQEGIPVILSPYTAFDIAGIMYENGIKGTK